MPCEWSGRIKLAVGKSRKISQACLPIRKVADKWKDAASWRGMPCLKTTALDSVSLLSNSALVNWKMHKVIHGFLTQSSKALGWFCTVTGRVLPTYTQMHKHQHPPDIPHPAPHAHIRAHARSHQSSKRHKRWYPLSNRCSSRFLFTRSHIVHLRKLSCAQNSHMHKRLIICLCVHTLHYWYKNIKI